MENNKTNRNEREFKAINDAYLTSIGDTTTGAEIIYLDSLPGKPVLRLKEGIKKDLVVAVIFELIAGPSRARLEEART